MWYRLNTLVWYHRNTCIVRTLWYGIAWTLWCDITGTLWCGITGTCVVRTFPCGIARTPWCGITQTLRCGITGTLSYCITGTLWCVMTGTLMRHHRNTFTWYHRTLRCGITGTRSRDITEHFGVVSQERVRVISQKHYGVASHKHSLRVISQGQLFKTSPRWHSPTEVVGSVLLAETDLVSETVSLFTDVQAASFTCRAGFKHQALVYDILPSTTAVFSYVIGSWKRSAVFGWCSNSSKFVTNDSNKTRRVIYSRQQRLHQHK